MFDVAIVGCGIVGAAAAYELSRYRLRVIIIEKENDVAVGTTRANSAILHAGYDPEPGTMMAKLNVEGVRLAKELCRKLDVPYRQCGSLVLAFTPRELALLKTLYHRGKENGVQELELLTKEQTLRMEPSLTPGTLGALYAPGAAIVNPWEYCLALAETAVRNGAELRLNSPVIGIERLPGGFQLSLPTKKVQARYILNAAGIHADKIHNMVASPSFQILPVRGEYYLLDKSAGNLVEHVIFQCPTRMGKGTLVAPTVHGNLIVGPNNEPVADGSDTSTTRDGLEQVAEMACKSVPSLDLKESIRNFSGVRAVSDQEDFIIRRAEDSAGFIDLAGIKSPGLSAAPAIARMAAALLEEAGLTLTEKTDFIDTRRRVRFRELSLEEKEALIRKDSAYGQVICRCETITEGEILDALRGPIPPQSVDGIKRRCGSGMGRCQGGFCTPKVMELLCRAEGKDPLTLLQDTAGSCLLAKETKGGAADV